MSELILQSIVGAAISLGVGPLDADDEALVALCGEGPQAGHEYRIAGDGRSGSSVLRIPDDFDPESRWPLIVHFHGYSDGLGPNVILPRAVTRDRGFVLLGMDYGTEHYYQTLDPDHLGYEERRLDTVLETLRRCIPLLPDAVFLSGYSQGGYHVTNLGERMLDRLAGLVILGAGRGFGVGRMPPRGLIRDKPLFIGVGEEDEVHGARGRASAVVYARWGAVVTLETWPGVDHIEGWRWYQEDPFHGATLRRWLRHTANELVDERYEEYESSAPPSAVSGRGVPARSRTAPGTAPPGP